MTLLAVDPGIAQCGVAVFEDDRLVRAGLVRSLSPDPDYPAPERCAVMAVTVLSWVGVPRTDLALEWPQVYRAGRGKRGADPNDLLLLAGVCAALSAGVVGSRVTSVLPREWKGTLPKNVACERVEKRLAPSEARVVGDLGLPPSKVHHVLDAVGIGLHVIGRGLRSR